MSDELKSELLAGGMQTVATAAEFLCLSKGSVYNLMEAGLLPYLKIRGARRIPRNALMAFARKCMVGV